MNARIQFNDLIFDVRPMYRSRYANLHEVVDGHSKTSPMNFNGKIGKDILELLPKDQVRPSTLEVSSLVPELLFSTSVRSFRLIWL